MRNPPNTNIVLSSGNRFRHDWTPEEIAEVDKVLRTKCDWTCDTGIFQDERYYIASREEWSYDDHIYVRDGFGRFLSVLKQEQRDDKGQKEVEVKKGNQEGPYFSQRSFDLMLSIAAKLGLIVPYITNIYVWYDNKEDFTHVEFDVDGSHYNIRYYKAFTVVKDDDQSSNKNFYIYYYKLLQFFRHGNHRRWRLTPTKKDG